VDIFFREMAGMELTHIIRQSMRRPQGNLMKIGGEGCAAIIDQKSKFNFLLSESL